MDAVEEDEDGEVVIVKGVHRGVTAAAAAAAVVHRPLLTRLDLAWNDIGDVGAAALAAALATGPSLRWLDLAGNGITEAGAGALAAALRGNTVLLHLDLRYNPLGRPGLDTLTAGVEFNTALQVLRVGDDDDDDGSGSIGEAGRSALELNNRAPTRFVTDEATAAGLDDEVHVVFDGTLAGIDDLAGMCLLETLRFYNVDADAAVAAAAAAGSQLRKISFIGVYLRGTAPG